MHSGIFLYVIALSVLLLSLYSSHLQDTNLVVSSGSLCFIIVFFLCSLHYEKFHDGSVKCIEEEIPFAVPQGWEWERLGNITTIARGGSPRPIEAYITNDKSGINWIKISDTEKDGKYICTTKEKIKPEGIKKSRYVEKGDFLLTNSMSFGRPYILKTNGCIHDGWLVIGNIQGVFYQDYLYYALSSGFMYQTLSLLAAGSTVKNLKSDTVKSIIFPIPPINEQRRIADKLDNLITYITQIETDKAFLQNIIKQIKSQILNLAIRGKLVPQDPNDEPASVLLERIRAEKEELIKQGKIQRDKKESVIFRGEDNSYYRISSYNMSYREQLYELPANWSICILPDIAKIDLGKTLDTSKNTGKPHSYLRSVNVRWCNIDLSDLKEMLIEDEELERYSVQKNDLLICEGGDVGRSCVWTSNETICYQNALHRVRLYDKCNPFFFMYYMMHYESKGIIKDMCKGVTIKHLTWNVLSTIPFSLPPVSEQNRIVNAIESAFAQLDEIANAIA